VIMTCYLGISYFPVLAFVGINLVA